MLPLWRNRVYIALSPERLSMVKLGRGLKPKLLGQFDEAIQLAANNQPLWQAATDRLAQVLAQPEWQNADADIVLSNKLVRFAVLPPNAKLNKQPAQEAFARHVLGQTYGTAVSHWKLRIQPHKAAEPWLVSAIDQALLANLHLMCSSNKLKPGLLNPLLVPVFNHFGKQLKADPAWLVIHEPGTSLCLLIKGTEISSVSNLSHTSSDDLAVLLDRENLLSSLPEPCKTVYVHAPCATQIALKNINGYMFNKLEAEVQQGLQTYANEHYALAPSGVK